MVGIRRTLRKILFGRTRGLRARVRTWLRAPWRRRRDEPAEEASLPRPDAVPGAPPGYADVLAADELAPGQLVEVIVAGRTVAVANVDGRFLAVTGACPHAGGPLAEGYLEGATLTCPLHGWTFDLHTGRCHVDPAASLQRWEVSVVDGRVCVQIDA